jgi:hypothetical protein
VLEKDLKWPNHNGQNKENDDARDDESAKDQDTDNKGVRAS